MKISAFSLIIIITVLYSCQIKPSNYILITGTTQGTTYHISYQTKNNINLKTQIDNLLAGFDSSLSTYVPYSVISRINYNDPTVITDKYFETVYKKSLEVWEKSEGAFDITVAPFVNAWGFGPGESMNIDSNKIDSLLQLVGMQKIKLINHKVIKENQNIKIDVNAIAQGYTVDLVCEFLKKQGIRNNFMVEIGGEVRAKGKNKNGEYWRIGIDKPVESNVIPGEKLQAIIHLKNKSVSTSGNYRKFYVKNGVKYSHTINPKTGYPARSNLLSVSVLASDCMTADAYATAFMVMGLKKSWDFVNKNKFPEAYFIYSDDSGNFKVKMTKAWNKLIIKQK